MEAIKKKRFTTVKIQVEPRVGGYLIYLYVVKYIEHINSLLSGEKYNQANEINCGV